MGKGKGGGENSKKAAGNARKAEAANKKKADADAQQEAADAELWSQGAKGKNAKKEAEAAKKAEAKAAKAARDAELEAETAKAGAKKPVVNQKKATANRRAGIDAALAGSDLHAHNVDDAIAALEITSGKSSDKIDRHPERRFKPALRAYEERRLPEIREEHPGLRLNQYQNRIYEEFKKSPENPFNQVNVAFNATREDLRQTAEGVKQNKEDRLIR